MKNIEITHEFKMVLNMMENTNNSIFLTGKAGTGKSTLIDKFIEETDKNVVVVAPTGIAAINVNGQTIHSFFKLKSNGHSVKIDRNLGRIFDKIDTIIIDEISMVRADILDAIDLTLRANKKNVVFGGVQMVFVGDLFQLPPVVTKTDRQYIDNNYRSEYFFDADCMINFEYKTVELTNIFRQSNSDIQFKEILNNVRTNSNSLDLELLNSRHVFNADCDIFLTARNDAAEKRNAEKLDKLSGKLYSYNADTSGNFTENQYPYPATIHLKEGAKVVMLNNDKESRWVNGTIAKVLRCGTSYIDVDVDGSYCKVERHEREKYEYYTDAETNEIKKKSVGKFIQFPLKLAYAITIHKSQGQTFENIVIDMCGGAFAHGQMYVALSRCKSLNGISLKQKIRKSDIIVDKRIIDYYEKIRMGNR